MRTVKKSTSPKVVILCGGKGSRLREVTEFLPKPLVPVGGMPVIWHIMKLYSYYGFNDFILCLGYKGEMIKEYFLNFKNKVHNFTLDLGSKDNSIQYHGNTASENWRITFVDTGLEAQTGSRVYRVKDFLKNDKEFFLTYSDGVADIDIQQLLSFHRKKNKILTVTGVRPISPFGLIEHADGYVKNFQEKPRLKDFISGGFFVCNTKIFKHLEDDESCIFEDAPMKKLAKEGELSLYQHEGFWSCMDTQKHVDELNAIWHKGQVPWRVW